MMSVSPPEPDWEGVDDFTCSMEVDLAFVTPDLRRAINELRSPIIIPIGLARPPEWLAGYRDRVYSNRADQVIRELRAIETLPRTCGWEGETDYCIIGSRLYWTCPCCGTEHDDPVEGSRYEPDPDAERDRWLEDRLS